MVKIDYMVYKNLPDSVLKDTVSLEGPLPSSFFGVTLNS